MSYTVPAGFVSFAALRVVVVVGSGCNFNTTPFYLGFFFTETFPHTDDIVSKCHVCVGQRREKAGQLPPAAIIGGDATQPQGDVLSKYTFSLPDCVTTSSGHKVKRV